MGLRRKGLCHAHLPRPPPPESCSSLPLLPLRRSPAAAAAGDAGGSGCTAAASRPLREAEVTRFRSPEDLALCRGDDEEEEEADADKDSSWEALGPADVEPAGIICMALSLSHSPKCACGCCGCGFGIRGVEVIAQRLRRRRR